MSKKRYDDKILAKMIKKSQKKSKKEAFSPQKVENFEVELSDFEVPTNTFDVQKIDFEVELAYF